MSSIILVAETGADIPPELAQRYRIMSIPTLIFFKDGELVQREAGGKSKGEILEMIGLLRQTAR